jgi:3'-phosphoadenosine 5'-phosphosulfate sulfotransferase (PAPS reductase)/FAD synthetase
MVGDAAMMDLSPLDRHEKIALLYSGGKDSRACVELLRDRLDEITIYHLDTGDLLPEMRACVAEVEADAPHFVRISTDVSGWIAANGLPTDLLPFGNHPIGYMLGHASAKLVPRYDCCYINLMGPLFTRAHDDGCTLIIRGTKRVDMPRMAAENGEVGSGMELWLPLHDWTNEQVFAYLAQQGVKLSRVYDYVVNSPECARCSAWWGEGRRDYLKKYHPELWAEYDARLQIIIDAIAPSLALLRREAGVT